MELHHPRNVTLVDHRLASCYMYLHTCTFVLSRQNLEKLLFLFALTAMLKYECWTVELLCMAAHELHCNASVTAEASASVLTSEKVPASLMPPSD